MRTSHGAHIPGTRLGNNPPIHIAKCGGISRCPDCIMEADAVTYRGSLVYSRAEQTIETDEMLKRVYQILGEAGADRDLSLDIISAFQEQGILFRERNTQ